MPEQHSGAAEGIQAVKGSLRRLRVGGELLGRAGEATLRDSQAVPDQQSPLFFVEEAEVARGVTG